MRIIAPLLITAWLSINTGYDPIYRTPYASFEPIIDFSWLTLSFGRYYDKHGGYNTFNANIQYKLLEL